MDRPIYGLSYLSKLNVRPKLVRDWVKMLSLKNELGQKKNRLIYRA